MKTAELKRKVKSMIKDDKKYINALIEKAIKSGCMDIAGAEDNYLLPKKLLSAIYREMSRQYGPLYISKQNKRDIDNIFNNL